MSSCAPPASRQSHPAPAAMATQEQTVHAVVDAQVVSSQPTQYELKPATGGVTSEGGVGQAAALILAGHEPMPLKTAMPPSSTGLLFGLEPVFETDGSAVLAISIELHALAKYARNGASNGRRHTTKP
jgi:hypothetical protein